MNASRACRAFARSFGRRRFGVLALVLHLSLGGLGCGRGIPTETLPLFYPDTAEVPTKGPDVDGLLPFDTAVRSLLKKWNVPGAAIAVAKDGKLILARGYGYADFESQEQVQPTSMFRIGSVSKLLTAMAILHLRDQGLIDLDARVFEILTQFQVPPGGDARLKHITIRQLLHHSGGWDRDIRGDPLDLQSETARALGIPTPVLCPDVIRFQMGRPLDFTPGTQAVYSNFGYCILGEVVEAVSGHPVELYIRDNVLAPMDVHAMSIGYSHLSERGPEEVKYYDFNGAPLVNSLFPGEGKVPMAYGSFEMMTYAGCGGWIGSAVDLTRVMSSIDGSRTAQFLSPESMADWLEDPHIPSFVSAGTWYGMGIFVTAPPQLWYHAGSVLGGQTMLLHDANGYSWAIVTNSRTGDPDDFATDEANAMLQALGNGMTHSPSTDLYPQFPSSELPARSQ